MPARPAMLLEAAGPYLPGYAWHEPDVDALSALMRQVVEDPDHARQVGRPLAQPQLPNPRPDRPGRDQHHPPPALTHPVQLVGEGLDAAAVEPAGRVREHVRADLDDDRVGLCDDALSDRIDHAANSCRGRWVSRSVLVPHPD